MLRLIDIALEDRGRFDLVLNAVQPGGEGGGVLASDIEETYGGHRTTGTAARGSDGTITFTPDSD